METIMKFIFAYFFLSLLVGACSHLPGVNRAPSSIPKSFTPMGTGTRITLKQPVPFVNAEDKKQVVSFKSRKKFSSNGEMFSCLLSVQVPKQVTYFVQEGTALEYKDSPNKVAGNYSFQPTSGSLMHLACVSDLNGELKKKVYLEEVQLAFPADMLVIENVSTDLALLRMSP